MTFTFAQKLAEVRREISMRKHVYPTFVARGKFPQADADRQIAIMESIAEDYARAVARDKEKISPQLPLEEKS
jgi:hypothetical protein